MSDEARIEKEAPRVEREASKIAQRLSAGLPLNANGKLDPQSLFEMVSKHYDSWSTTIGRQFGEEEGFSPFPSEDAPPGPSEPIFNYSLLEALERASSEFARREGADADTDADADADADAENDATAAATPATESLLHESEIDYLQNKIVQIFKSNNVAFPAPPEAGVVDSRQDDYDIDEISDSISDSMYNDYHPTHHIEVELNEEGGESGRQRTVFNNQYDFEDEGGPSCEFTFEYDHTGKLVPTHNNVEEKLRLMSLQSAAASTSTVASAGKKKKKKKKSNAHPQGAVALSPSCCLFCEYEAIYGVRPRQLIKWYDQKMRRDEMRRDEIRKKLENAKSKALKKQRELRQRQQQQLQQRAGVSQNGHVREQTGSASAASDAAASDAAASAHASNESLSEAVAA
ncbi:Protein IBD2 [[Candida] zeylanoides]